MKQDYDLEMRKKYEREIVKICSYNAHKYFQLQFDHCLTLKHCNL